MFAIIYAWLAVVLALAVIAAASLAGFSARGAWDDAYMFVRYADNLLEHGTLAWQPGGEPTYGLTSLGYLAIVLPVRLVVRDNPATAVVVSSVLCALAFVLLLGRLVYRHATRDARVAPWLVAFTYAVIALSVSRFAPHVVSGMDTMFALAYLTAYVLLASSYETRRTTATAVWLGLWGGFAFWVRPDLIVYTLGIALALVIFAPSATARRQAVVIAALTLLATSAEMTLASSYFGSALPLPFYAKSLKLYGDFIYSHYRFTGPRELAHYMESYWLLLVPLASVVVWRRTMWWQRSTAGEKGLALATLAFIAYYAAGVLQIMGFHQRFYYPTLPALAFLSARAVADLVGSRRPPGLDGQVGSGRAPLDGQVGGDRSPADSRLSPYAAAVAALALLPQLVIVGERLTREIVAGRVARFGLVEHYRETFAGWWLGLDQVSRLPDDLVIATTEIGLPAAMNPRKTIVDLAGLNEREFARQGFSAERLFEKYRPDVIYLPHPHYREMIAEIVRHARFVADYDYFPSEMTGAGMGFALRRDGRYADQLRRIVRTTGQNGGVTPSGSGASNENSTPAMSR